MNNQQDLKTFLEKWKNLHKEHSNELVKYFRIKNKEIQELLINYIKANLIPLKEKDCLIMGGENDCYVTLDLEDGENVYF